MSPYPFFPSETSHFIRMAGYPHEQHTVITDDGYVLQMERIPQPRAKDVVFFQHGVFDTTMGWVAYGATGSLAFAAFDQGFDVWLGSSRNNPPRSNLYHTHYSHQYWQFSNDDIGVHDIGCQVDHIHHIKCLELADVASAELTRDDMVAVGKSPFSV